MSARTSLAVLVACALFETGCANVAYRNKAFYSADIRGYVVPADAEARAHPVAPVGHLQGAWLVLRDPVTLDKLRCREEVESVVAANATALRARDQEIDARLTNWELDFPFAAAGYAAALVGYSLVDFSALPYWTGRSPSSVRLLDAGDNAFRMGDWARASDLIETALLRDEWNGKSLLDNFENVTGSGPSMKEATYALYTLGLAYEQQQRADRAAAAFRRFVGCALLRDAATYADAESRLARLGSPVRACDSSEPILVTWPEAP